MSVAPSLDLSVLIATRSRADLLRGTLESMCGLEAGALRWELVVVDNGSSDATAALLEAYRTRLPLVTLHQPVPGKNRSLNATLDRLRGALTILTDDDVIVPADWLAGWHAAAQRWPNDAVFGGRIVPTFPAGTPAWITREDLPGRAQCFAAFAPSQPEGPYGGTVFGANFAVRTALFERFRFVGALGPAGGTYAMGGETEFMRRLRAAGHRIIYVPDVSVQHVIESNRLTLPALFARARNAGRGDELRRALDAHRSPTRLLLRLYVQIMPKIAAYFVVYRLTSWWGLAWRFRRGYKLHTAYGRRLQLRELLNSSRNPGSLG